MIHLFFFKPKTALHDLIEKLCNEAGFHPRKVFEGFEERTVYDLVGANLGVAIVPYIPDLDKSKISMIRIQSPKCFRVIQMVWRINVYMSPAVTNLSFFVQRRKNGNCDLNNYLGKNKKRTFPTTQSVSGGFICTKDNKTKGEI